MKINEICNEKNPKLWIKLVFFVGKFILNSFKNIFPFIFSKIFFENNVNIFNFGFYVITYVKGHISLPRIQKHSKLRTFWANLKNNLITSKFTYTIAHLIFLEVTVSCIISMIMQIMAFRFLYDSGVFARVIHLFSLISIFAFIYAFTCSQAHNICDDN